jgi:hypothetical protein
VIAPEGYILATPEELMREIREAIFRSGVRFQALREDRRALEREIESGLGQRARRPLRAGELRALVALGKDDVLEQRPGLTDEQVEGVINSDWKHLGRTTMRDVFEDKVWGRAEELFPEGDG